MKCFVILLALFVLSSGECHAEKPPANECQVRSFYEDVTPAKRDMKVLTKNGEMEDAALVLVPATLDAGTYNISITRKGDNIYKVETPDNYKFRYGKFYIETKYCSEYANGKDVVLVVESSYSSGDGKILFNLKK
jgi:hypothetical protein